MSPQLASLAAVGGAFALSAAGTAWLVRRSHAALLDHPNDRSLHQTPVPRSGGIGVLFGLTLSLLLASWGAGPDVALAWLLVSASLVAGVSLWDDFGHVSRRLRLLVQASAACVLVAGGLIWSRLDLPGIDWTFGAPVAWVLTLLYVVWMINLYNFMDGMDGLAGGMGLFGFGALAALGWQGGDSLFALVSACTAAACGGFLTSNFPPARIFMGDLGSSTLGLLAAGLSLWGCQRGLFPLWAAWLAFSPFIVDATSTLLRRLVRGERIWEPHRSHHYQRLVLAGWGHRKTLIRAYLVMAGTAACAVAAPSLPVRDQWALIVAWAIIYSLIAFRVRLAERQAASGQP